jgi:hypothetical protein
LGLNSGLAWLAWTLEVPTLTVEGGAPVMALPSDVVKVQSRKRVCRECFTRHAIVKSEWDWCPDHHNDARRFECSATITAAEVIAAIQQHLLPGVA